MGRSNKRKAGNMLLGCAQALRLVLLRNLPPGRRIDFRPRVSLFEGLAYNIKDFFNPVKGCRERLNLKPEKCVHAEI